LAEPIFIFLTKKLAPIVLAPCGVNFPSTNLKHMRARTQTHTNTRPHTHTHTCTHAQKYTHTYEHNAQTHSKTHTHTHTRTLTYSHTSTRTRTYTKLHTQKHWHTHKDAHIHSQKSNTNTHAHMHARTRTIARTPAHTHIHADTHKLAHISLTYLTWMLQGSVRMRTGEWQRGPVDKAGFAHARVTQDHHFRLELALPHAQPNKKVIITSQHTATHKRTNPKNRLSHIHTCEYVHATRTHLSRGQPLPLLCSSSRFYSWIHHAWMHGTMTSIWDQFSTMDKGPIILFRLNFTYGWIQAFVAHLWEFL